MEYPKILLAGDSAVIVEFENQINEEINHAVTSYVQILNKNRINGIVDIVPTFCSVMIQYDPAFISYTELTKKLQLLFHSDNTIDLNERRMIEIPVCYGGKYGPDLGFVASHAGLSEEEVIKIHSSKKYLIYMLGFLPGFPYLGELDPRIFTPRLSKPRLQIWAGSVGIGGEQTGLYPLDSPGGWQIIGTTPVEPYKPDRNPPIIYEAGDYIRFIPIDEKTFVTTKEMVLDGKYEYRIKGVEL